MEIPFKKLQTELEKSLSFWLENATNNSVIFPEVSISGIPNSFANTGAMYVSRILYGASSAYKILKNDAYLMLADLSFHQLQKFQHPKGGYYWATTSTSTILHDTDNTCMAQAFALYGLVAYAQIKPSKEVDIAIKNQYTFIQNTLADKKHNGYLDGFNENWQLTENTTKALGTHLHLLEAFVSLYEYTNDENLVAKIEDLISIITSKFITKDTFDCLHRLTPNWEPLPNQVWAGHNAEVSWILCDAAKTINNKQQILKCNQLAVKMMDNVILKAFDTKNNGVFNVLVDAIPTENVKIWWPQAETVLGLFNCYNITKKDKYKLKAIELMDFISCNFIAPNGEWYTEIWNDNTPNTEQPIVHFWKSMYHTVRYYNVLLSTHCKS